MTGFILVVLLLLFVLLLGLPVAFSLGVTSLALILNYGLPLKLLGNTIFTSTDSFVIIAVPLFILMSQVLLDGHIGDDLFGVMNAWVCHLPGGLAIATLLSCAFFAAITGSGAATSATIGMVAYPAMTGRGYDKKFTLGLLAAGGTLGILIPPSIPMILYASITEDSVGKLFSAGIIPGLVLTGLLIAYAVFRCAHGCFTPMPRKSWRERFDITRRNILGIALPFIIVGGIYSGVFTPTEAAAVGLFYSLILTLFVYRTIKLRELPDICLKSVCTSCMIAMVVAGAVLFGRVMTMLEIPQMLTEFVIAKNLSPLLFIVAMNILMLVLGCILETVSIVLLTMPLVAPLLGALGIDSIWYAVIVTVNMEMALITPPVGMNLYVIKGMRDDIRMGEVIRGATPFVALVLLFLIIIISFPGLSTWLPSMMK
ncbi:MAG: TRAP transporter large permease [Synergistaceae bacterium]|jgi:C4-dicarboxylate transporter DctM subunit|nr:TRAP transporter large permease [Synergistaceae bacterium]